MNSVMMWNSLAAILSMLFSVTALRIESEDSTNVVEIGVDELGMCSDFRPLDYHMDSDNPTEMDLPMRYESGAEIPNSKVLRENTKSPGSCLCDGRDKMGFNYGFTGQICNPKKMGQLTHEEVQQELMLPRALRCACTRLFLDHDLNFIGENSMVSLLDQAVDRNGDEIPGQMTARDFVVDLGSVIHVTKDGVDHVEVEFDAWSKWPRKGSNFGNASDWNKELHADPNVNADADQNRFREKPKPISCQHWELVAGTAYTQCYWLMKDTSLVRQALWYEVQRAVVAGGMKTIDLADRRRFLEDQDEMMKVATKYFSSYGRCCQCQAAKSTWNVVLGNNRATDVDCQHTCNGDASRVIFDGIVPQQYSKGQQIDPKKSKEHCDARIQSAKEWTCCHFIDQNDPWAVAGGGGTSVKAIVSSHPEKVCPREAQMRTSISKGKNKKDVMTVFHHKIPMRVAASGETVRWADATEKCKAKVTFWMCCKCGGRLFNVVEGPVGMQAMQVFKTACSAKCGGPKMMTFGTIPKKIADDSRAAEQMCQEKYGDHQNKDDIKMPSGPKPEGLTYEMPSRPEEPQSSFLSKLIVPLIILAVVLACAGFLFYLKVIGYFSKTNATEETGIGMTNAMVQ